jgi:hypothetical protein
MNMQITIKPISIDDVLANNKVRYNTNNHWENDVKPSDYDEIIRKTNTNKWIDQFKEYKKIIIDTKQDLNWMKKAFEIGSKTGRFPHMFDDELEDMCMRYKKYDIIFEDNSYFIRTENVSLKEGKNGIGPYKDFKSIIESIVTCRLGHSPLYEDTTFITLYLIKFQENLNGLKEFRVFVHKNKITAISQQSLYDSNVILVPLSEKDKFELINKWINLIIEYFENEVKKRFTYIDSYVMDFAILDDDTPYFIELNSFGKEYASGSALFGWIQDYSILYGLNGNSIEFRYSI